MGTPVTNFGLVTVNGQYSASDIQIQLQTGHGSRLPSAFPYPLTWWNSTDYAHAADDPNREIVLVTARATDVLTVTRGQEGTGASIKSLSAKVYRMSLSITKSMWDAIATTPSPFSGLLLQTNPDASLEKDSVELVEVEYISMEDGTVLNNSTGAWTGKEASIAGPSGFAGGLDAGTEENGVWYEIYAIASETGANRDLLLHKSHVWAIETNYPAGDDAAQPLKSDATNSNIAQGFQVGNDGPCIYVEVLLARFGNPSGHLYFTIETDSAGSPSGTVVDSTYQYSAARISTTPTWVRLPIRNNTSLSAATQYHLRMWGTWGTSPTNYIAWRYDASAPTYATGTLKRYNATAWSDAGGDALFSVGIERNRNNVVLPSGYTKKRMLGWVFNDAAGNFVQFVQIDRHRRNAIIDPSTGVVWIASGSAELVDLLAFIPPLKTARALVTFSGTGTSSGVLAVGDLRATDLATSGTSIGAQAVIVASGITTRPDAWSEVVVQYGGLMAQGTSGGSIWVGGFSW
jgi:hypothetical protein